MPKWGYYSTNSLGTRAQLHRSIVHTHTQAAAIQYTLPVCSVSVAVWKKLYNDSERERNKRYTWFLKETSSSVTAILLRPVLVNMDTYFFIQTGGFLIMLTLWLWHSHWKGDHQTMDNLAVYCSETGFTIKWVFQMLFLLCPKNQLIPGL